MSAPEQEPNWKHLGCPNCAATTKIDLAAIEAATCPRCGKSIGLADEVPLPDPNEFEFEDGTASASDSHPPERALTAQKPARPGFVRRELISDLNPVRGDDPILIPERVKHTTDEDLVSMADERVRVKRQSKRVEKELTGWDSTGSEELADGGGGATRPPKPVPRWKRIATKAAIAVVSLGFLCLIVYGVAASMRDKDGSEAEQPLPASPASAARDSLSALEAATLERETNQLIYRQARATAEKFLDARTLQERLAVVREPERVRPLMEAYYADPRHPDGPVPHRPIPEGGKLRVYNSLLMISIVNEDFSNRPLALERIAEGEFLVDWESFVGYCELPWDEIPVQRPTESILVRVRMKRGNYFNFGFRDDAWTCWDLDDAKGDQRLYGYTARSSPVEIALAEALRGRRGATYMLLKVRFPAGATEGNQVEITEMVANGWVAPATGER